MTLVPSNHTTSWRPRHIDDPDALSKLVGHSSTEVVDRVDQQRRDLARIIPAPSQALLDEPTHWYYYPWRRSVVHVLGPSAYQALRSDRNRNKITVGEQQRLRQLAIGVVGLSVGHTIAHTLALEGICGEIRLADFDEIELSNLNRIPGTVFDLGLNKAVVAARRIAELDPYIRVLIEPAGLTVNTTDDFMCGLDMIIEECDSFDLKMAVREAARKHRIPLVMESSDRGLLDVERYDLQPDRPLFHGLLGEAKTTELVGLSTREKVPYVLRALEADHLSAIMAASMTEVDETISTWPQLGADINLGAAAVATAVRRLGLGKPLRSGRVRVDLDQLLEHMAEPVERMSAGASAKAETEPEPPPAHPRDAVVHAARLAPSGGNVQPWTFILDDSAVQIHLDPDQTSTLDVAFRASHVSLGAALFNARVAAAHHGILGEAQIFPSGDEQPPVAVLTFADGHDADLAALYRPMLRRVSNRNLNVPNALPDGVVPALQTAAHAEGARAHVITGRTPMRELSELFGESDRIRFLTEHLHSDMMRELRWPGEGDLDRGLDVRTLGLDAADLAKLEVARRRDVMAILAAQNLGRALGESSRERISGAPAMIVITIDRPALAHYVGAGQAAERAWIEAERLGLSTQVMSPVFTYAVDPSDYEHLSPQFAERLRTLHQEFNDLAGIGNRHIALTMRIGYAPSIRARSRRLPPDRTIRPA